MAAILVQLGEVGPLGRGPFVPGVQPQMYKLTLPLHSMLKGNVFMRERERMVNSIWKNPEYKGKEVD